MNFSILKINDLILKGIQDAGYTEMTDIQQSTIPAALEHHDIVAQAPTGTGKTCAFIVPTLEQVDLTKHEVQILVICPTRELALQITDEYKKIGKHIAQLKILTIFGGQKIDRQLKELKKSPQIIVGTPGRILDHLERRSLNLTKVKMAVLDEADEMLDMGFIRDIDKILKVTNNERQTILLSATMPKPILDITKRYQKNPQWFKATFDEKEIPIIKQYYVHINESNKVKAVEKIIQDNKFYLVLIFTNTRHKAKKLVFQFRNDHLQADALHSDLKQNARERVMRSFRDGKIQILIATDIAARGIDVKGVDAVFNYDVPKNMEYYVHRIGRTARAKAPGSAYTLISSDLQGSIRTIERKINEKLVECKVEGIEFDAQSNDRGFSRDRGAFPRKRFEHSEGSGERSHKNFERSSDRGSYQSKRFNDDKPFRRHDDNAKTFRADSNSKGDAKRFFVNIGSDQGVDNQSLKNTLLNECKISQEGIKDVWVKEGFSFVEVTNGELSKLESLKEINGHRVRIAEAKPRSTERSSGSRPFGRSSGGNRRPFNKGGFKGGFKKPRY